ncbi:MAG: carboxylating nicotinate-nucleotide diphosphorylase [Chloroflexi bacterium]|nr:carboxylating nicotinate-nucleotide diphosphorylase [Chloroflexota bacterium]MYK62413.1 carboxylating nicotinate-nucleotide diphosphorylase [Chloroflexota bacterium]
MPLSRHHVRSVVQSALEEDCAYNDATTSATIGESDIRASAHLVAKQSGVIAGIQVAEEAFKILDSQSEFIAHLNDGGSIEAGMKIASVSGKAAAILSAERTALNLLQRMSGIATLTARYVAAVRGTDASIVDTRKTVPGLRVPDKYSVLMGGGGNHRMSLADCILIKDNHIAAMKSQGMSIGDVVRHARSNAPFSIKIEIEVENVDDAVDAMNAGVDIVMLDNMPPESMREAVDLRVGQSLLEASGNVTLANVRQVAETGVDIISIGELTHSVSALDISLDFSVD